MRFLGTTVSWAVSATALECDPSPPPTVERWTVCLSAGEKQHTRTLPELLIVTTRQLTQSRTVGRILL